MLVISIQSVFSFKSLELDCQAPAFDYSLIHSTLDPYCMAPYAHGGVVPSGSFELGLAGLRGGKAWPPAGHQQAHPPGLTPCWGWGVFPLPKVSSCLFFLLHACLFLLESLDEVFQVYPTGKRPLDTHKDTLEGSCLSADLGICLHSPIRAEGLDGEVWKSLLRLPLWPRPW